MSETRKITDHAFESWSKTYERSLAQFFMFDRVHRTILGLIPPDLKPGDILDLGCGTGRLLRRCASRWPAARLFGIDPTEGMIEKARELTAGATFYNSPAESLPLADGSIDLALSTVSFHHWQDQAQGLRQITRVLRPGARFYLADLVTPFDLNQLFHHGAQPGARSVRLLFEQAGLHILDQRWLMFHGLLVTVGEKNRTQA